MPFVAIPSIFRWAVLCGYALLVVLGHGGWHLVAPESSCGSQTCHVGHADSTPATVTTCCHGHVHTTTGGSAPPSNRDHEPGTPAAPHDSDHCSVCAVFSAPQTFVTFVVLVELQGEAIHVVEWHTVIVCLTRELLPVPRGPPVC